MVSRFAPAFANVDRKSAHSFNDLAEQRTPRCSTEKRTRNSGYTMSLAIEKIIAFV
jgi:hypothetical protein